LKDKKEFSGTLIFDIADIIFQADKHDF